MSRLNGVTLAGNGRIVSETMAYDKALNPGIKTHNYLGKIFANIFGTGTFTVRIDDKTYYLNRGRCYKLLDLNNVAHTNKKQDVLPKLQKLFDDMHVNDLLRPNADSSSESLSEQGISNQKSKNKSSIDSTKSESSEDHTRESTGSESSDYIETMRNTIASLTKKLEDLVNLTYEKYAERTIQSLVNSGVDQKTAQEALEYWGQSEYQSKIEELKDELATVQIKLINKLADISSQTNDSSSSESLKDETPLNQNSQAKTVSPTNPAVNINSQPIDRIQALKDDIALWTKELEDLENCSPDDFIQQEIDRLVAEGSTLKDAKETTKYAGQMQYVTNILKLKNKISTAETTLNALSH